MLCEGYTRAGKLFLEARSRYCSVASSERALPIRPLLQFGRSNPLHFVIAAEDKVDRLEACTASLPPEAAEPDAQPEAAAEPGAQQEAAAAAEPGAQQDAVAGPAEPDAQQEAAAVAVAAEPDVQQAAAVVAEPDAQQAA